MSANKLVRLRIECSDPRPDHASIDKDRKDIFICTPGAVALGEPEYFLRALRRIATIVKIEIEDLLIMFNPHDPCARMRDSIVSHGLGVKYSDFLYKNGVAAISLFLGKKVRLHNPNCDVISNMDMLRLFEAASSARNSNYNTREKVEISEVVVAPLLRTDEVSAKALNLSPDFFDLEGLKAVKGVIGGKFPHRNYHSSISSQERELMEAAFAAA